MMELAHDIFQDCIDCMFIIAWLIDWMHRSPHAREQAAYERGIPFSHSTPCMTRPAAPRRMCRHEPLSASKWEPPSVNTNILLGPLWKESQLTILQNGKATAKMINWQHEFKPHFLSWIMTGMVSVIYVDRCWGVCKQSQTTSRCKQSHRAHMQLASVTEDNAVLP